MMMSLLIGVLEIFTQLSPPPSVLPFYLSLAIPLELIRDLGRLAVPTCSYSVDMFNI